MSPMEYRRGVNRCKYSLHRTHLKQEWAEKSFALLILWGQGAWSRSGVAELPAIKKQVPWEWDDKSLLLLLRTFYFGLYCLELLKDLPVEDLFNVCCSIICVVCASVCILCTILFILPFCHEHQFGLNSRIAAPKFCTKSRFYFLRRNLFEQFAPTLPKSKIAWMEILFWRNLSKS